MSTAGSPYTDSQIRKQLATNQIAGGKPYLDTLTATEQITEADCDVTVSTSSGFWSAVKGSTYSKIWIADNAVINISGNSGSIVDKTIAGNRGVNGADGPLLYSTDRGENSPAWGDNPPGSGPGQMTLKGSTRLTGLRLRGWAHNVWDNPEHPGYIPLTDSSHRKARYARCAAIRSSNIEIDNCEIYGWCTSALACGTSTTGYDPHIHHNDIHDNMQTGFGYHVDVYRGRPIVEYNYFNAHRHAVDGFGFYNGGYVCRYNVFGPSQSSHAVDMHYLGQNSKGTTTDYNSRDFYGNAGGQMEIYRNTFTATHVISDANFDAGKWSWAASIRGAPYPRTGDTVQIYNNVFEHPQVEVNGGGSGIRDQTHNGPYNQQRYGDKPVNWSIPSSQIGSDGFSVNYSHGPNVFDGSTTTYDYNTVGAPINLEGTDVIPPPTAQLRVYPRAERTDGVPIEGAMVSITPYEDISEWYTGPYEVESAYELEYDGVYARFDGLPIGDYDITVEHPSYQTTGVNGLYLDETGRQPIVTMEPLREAEPTSPLTITVVGNPTADQSLSAFPEPSPSTASGSSDTGPSDSDPE